MNYTEGFDNRVIEELMSGGNFQNLMPSHAAYQRKMAIKYFNNNSKFLNVGCKEDPAKLGDWAGCINLDASDWDEHTQTRLSEVVRNFVHHNYFDYTLPYPLDGIVLGEVLEHCTEDVANEIVEKMRREVKDKGVLIFTVPHDPRSKEEQLKDQCGRTEQFFEVAPGITSWHQTVWTKKALEELMESNDLTFDDYESAGWDESRDMHWHFFTARKK